MLNTAIITFDPATMTKVGDFDGLIGIQHANGYVGIYCEIEDDDFGQISPTLTKNPNKTGAEIAAEMTTK